MELALQSDFSALDCCCDDRQNGSSRSISLAFSPLFSPGWYLTILFLAALTNIDAGWFMTLNTLDWVLILVSCIGMNDATLSDIRTRMEI